MKTFHELIQIACPNLVSKTKVKKVKQSAVMITNLSFQTLDTNCNKDVKFQGTTYHIRRINTLQGTTFQMVDLKYNIVSMSLPFAHTKTKSIDEINKQPKHKQQELPF